MPIPSSMLVIDDDNFSQHLGPQIPGGYGLIPRDYSKVAYGAVEYAGPLPLPTIPRAEWPDRIADMERTKSRLSDIIDAAGIPCLDQGSVGYCHAFSPCHAAMSLRAVMGQPFKLLSASSVGGPVSGYRNRGAWILDDLKRAAEFGFSEEKFYPMLTTKNEWTPEGEASSAENKITEWWELRQRDFDDTATCLLSRMPVCVGLNYWSHAVSFLDLVQVSPGKFGVLFQNSWSENYGGMGNGRAILTGTKMIADEQYTPRQMTASD